MCEQQVVCVTDGLKVEYMLSSKRLRKEREGGRGEREGKKESKMGGWRDREGRNREGERGKKQRE